MLKILIVEDDKVIFEELRKLFLRNGYDVTDGRAEGGMNGNFDLAVLDIGLPGASGYDICFSIKQTKQCPVIFLTSMDKPENELMGFAVGGDDYIRKPFNPAVLLARVGRLLEKKKQSQITAGRLILDTVRLEAKYEDKSIPLSKTEFTVLRVLAEAGGVVTQKEIIENLWDNDSYIDENILFVNIARIREKLKSIGLDGLIKTIRGAGYLLES